MKPRKRPRPTSRKPLPEVPEAAATSPPAATTPEPDPIPEPIRRMLEAAYT